MLLFVRLFFSSCFFFFFFPYGFLCSSVCLRALVGRKDLLGGREGVNTHRKTEYGKKKCNLCLKERQRAPERLTKNRNIKWMAVLCRSL